MKKRAEKEKKEAKKRKREREKTLGNTNFSPEVDAVSGASIMKDGDDIIGNTQMLAYMTQNATGCDIAAIHTEKPYPKDYGETTRIAGTERKEGVYPKLGRVGKLRQRALTAILPPELRHKKLDVA